jgi:hypothetical protein
MSKVPDGSSLRSVLRTRSVVVRAVLATVGYLLAVGTVAAVEPSLNVRDLSLGAWAAGAFTLFVYLVRIGAGRGALREPFRGTLVVLLTWCAVMAAGAVAFQLVYVWPAASPKL